MVNFSPCPISEINALRKTAVSIAGQNGKRVRNGPFGSRKISCTSKDVLQLFPRKSIRQALQDLAEWIFVGTGAELATGKNVSDLDSRMVNHTLRQRPL